MSEWVWWLLIAGAAAGVATIVVVAAIARSSLVSSFFYEHGAEHEARIHHERCGHCWRGVERQAVSATPSTEAWWHGPYETQEQAQGEAERMGLAVELCGSCRTLTP